MAGHTVAFRFRMSHAIVAGIAAPNMLIWAPWRGGGVKTPGCGGRGWCAVERLILREGGGRRRRPGAAGGLWWGGWDRAGLLLRRANRSEQGNRLVPVPRRRASVPLPGQRSAPAGPRSPTRPAARPFYSGHDGAAGFPEAAARCASRSARTLAGIGPAGLSQLSPPSSLRRPGDRYTVG